LSGLLGIGGAVLVVPAILYLGPSVGLNMDIHVVTTLSMAFVFFSGLFGFLSHRRQGGIYLPLILWLGLGVTAGSLVGGLLQVYFPQNVILEVFSGFTLFAGLTMLWPLRRESAEFAGFSRVWAVGGSFLAGFVAATAGVGGASLLIPFMIFVLRVPTRTAIGSALALVMLAGAFGFLGRVAHTAVPWLWILALLLGALPGALAGSFLSLRLPTVVLRRVFAVIVFGVALRTGLSLFQ